MDDQTGIIHKNYSKIQSCINAACQRSHRSPESVTFIAVTKYARLEWVHALLELGCTHLGESRTPQLEERASLLPADLHWHFIGPLQRNKVRRTVQHSSLIHSVDSLKLLSTIDRIAAESNLQPRVLIEVNLAGETNKKGFSREELVSNWSSLCDHAHVKLEGLMTMAPHTADPELARPVFRELSQLRDQLQVISPAQISLHELSMGMSGDFEVAIEEGATLIRIGSALYEGLESGS
ncbi:YggS family pyridoxal phosphate-dependent enzyme [Gimesia fumaroli]|uniref:Pyridoxal phosphate homeostasis protein n=1 Tax=Gimesia fumaroli TaxID=2527976 RepID=A0A518II89_9PLAN|nr:YggS family pyridoxal phosphate-dependent enzyme [Gimesia fumaroli]QDV52812.1 Pyridoxal phosphate homeostasis protein [Gimesia fumaroli]